MKTLADSGVTGVIEVAPGGTLVGLLKRAEPSIQTFALKSPEDISGARAFAKEHGGK
jgi:[acyl-carrier-protein] S-malonyltransferase